MKDSLTLFFKIILTIFLLIGLTAPAQAQQEKVIELQLNLVSIEENLSNIVDSLITIAEDDTLEWEVRRKAIFVLGDIQSPKSIKYLLSNIEVMLMKKETLSDDQQMQEWPYSYTLKKKSKEDAWILVPFIYDRLEEDLSKNELVHIRSVMINKFGERMARAILYERKMSPKAKENAGKLFR